MMILLCDSDDAILIWSEIPQPNTQMNSIIKAWTRTILASGEKLFYLGKACCPLFSGLSLNISEEHKKPFWCTTDQRNKRTPHSTPPHLSSQPHWAWKLFINQTLVIKFSTSLGLVSEGKQQMVKVQPLNGQFNLLKLPLTCTTYKYTKWLYWNQSNELSTSSCNLKHTSVYYINVPQLYRH